jgi:squalene cyclase
MEYAQGSMRLFEQVNTGIWFVLWMKQLQYSHSLSLSVYEVIDNTARPAGN